MSESTVAKQNGIYLKNIKIENYGAISNFEYECQFDDEGKPTPIVLVGKNGSGKTLLISNIIHSIIEIKRKFYKDLPEVSDLNFYRVGSREYIQEGKDYSCVDMDFTQGVHFTSTVVNNPSKFDYSLLKKYPRINVGDNKLKEDGFFDSCVAGTQANFDNSVFLYFPVDRYYIPKWLNPNNEKLSFARHEYFLGTSGVDMIRDNLLQDIEPWILDVVIDKLIYEKRTVNIESNGKVISHDYYQGKNSTIQSLINQIVGQIFSGSKYHSHRIGISQKRNRKISIMAENDKGESVELSPTFQNLSSGEIMLLSMFCSILKEADRLYSGETLSLSDIQGIVLIDEIDIHLHSNFAKEILPKAMALFPKIQFIVSSHSPFYLLGMKQVFADRCEFVTMPDGTTMKNVENFEEIQRCYEMLDSNHKEMVEALDSAKTSIKNLERTLVVTEGKTDWKHIKNALSHFKTLGKYQDLDIEFWEYEETFGDSKLETLLENLAKVDNKHIIIGIFDSDDKTGKKYKTMKEFGNKVFGICIPDNPNYPNGISIEFLYQESDMLLTSAENRRLYLSSEFTQKAKRLLTDSSVSTTSNKVKEYYTNGIVKIIDEGVFDTQENSLALSKDDFAMYICNKTPPFDNVNLDKFIELLDNIQSIISQNSQ